MSSIYWVGVRESDLLGLDSMYEGSITFFGSGKNGNRCLFQNETPRKDHNVSDPRFDIFYTQMMQGGPAKFRVNDKLRQYKKLRLSQEWK